MVFNETRGRFCLTGIEHFVSSKIRKTLKYTVTSAHGTAVPFCSVCGCSTPQMEDYLREIPVFYLRLLLYYYFYYYHYYASLSLLPVLFFFFWCPLPDRAQS